MLSDSDLANLRQTLETKRAELLKEIDRLAADAGAKADCSVTDQADSAALQEQRRRAAALLSARQDLAREIDAALVRLDRGEYGFSESTGEPIALARLSVMPWARN